MQVYFGKVLAGEIQNPNSFSIKSVKILGSLDQHTAQIFRKLCSVSIVLHYLGNSIPFDARVPSLGGRPGNNALAKYGLGFGELNLLNEYGLIISDFNSWRDYVSSIGLSVPGTKQNSPLLRIPFLYQGKSWIFEPTSSYKLSSEFRIHGVSLTHSGRQLMKIVEPVAMDEFTHDLIQFFEQKKLLMKEISITGPHQVINGKIFEIPYSQSNS